VSAEDLRTLHPNRWLNDEIINAHISLLKERTAKWQRLFKVWESRTALGPHDGQSFEIPDHYQWKVYYFNTFFWPVLYSPGRDRGKLTSWTGDVGFPPEMQ